MLICHVDTIGRRSPAETRARFTDSKRNRHDTRAHRFTSRDDSSSRGRCRWRRRYATIYRSSSVIHENAELYYTPVGRVRGPAGTIRHDNGPISRGALSPNRIFRSTRSRRVRARAPVPSIDLPDREIPISSSIRR